MKAGFTKLVWHRTQLKMATRNGSFTRRRVASPLLVLVIVVIVALTSCARAPSDTPTGEAEKVTIAVTPWPASAAVYVAHEKGYFKDEGLQETLRKYLSGHLGLADVFTEKVDFATCGDTPIARAVIDGKPVSIISTISEIDHALLIIARKDQGISKLDDLRGKRVGRVKGTTADFFLYLDLTTSYVDQKDVQAVDLEADEVVGALLSGKVDAVSTWSPFTIQLRDKLGSNAAVLEGPGIYTMTWNIVATKEYTKARPETIKRFLRAIIRANDFIKDNPTQARAISAKYIGTQSPLYEKEWKNYNFTAELDQSLILNLEDQARWITSSGGATRKSHDFMDHVYANGLKAISPGAVRIVGK